MENKNKPDKIGKNDLLFLILTGVFLKYLIFHHGEKPPRVLDALAAVKRVKRDE